MPLYKHIVQYDLLGAKDEIQELSLLKIRIIRTLKRRMGNC